VLEAAEKLLDGRRDPLMVHAFLPMNLAATYNGLGLWDEAASALIRCDYDRDAHPFVLTGERMNQSCCSLGQGEPREALSIFAEVQAACREQNRWLDFAVVALYSVESHVLLEQRLQAIESCNQAIRVFQKLGCDSKTEEAMDRLSKLLEPLIVDAYAVRACVREIARRHGGCLPLPAASENR
jgi:hypothetical protein